MHIYISLAKSFNLIYMYGMYASFFENINFLLAAILEFKMAEKLPYGTCVTDFL